MDDELFDSLESFGSEPAELKLGSTFSGKGPGFHTLRCKYNFLSKNHNIFTVTNARVNKIHFPLL